MKKKNLLLTPGPTEIPPDVCKALGQPIIHHRTPEFQENLKKAVAGLQWVLKTKNDVYLMASSGTGAMEAAVANLLSPGDYALTVEGGKFGERWTELCEAYGVKTEVLKVEWGRSVQPEDVLSALKADPDIKAVFITHCETSTGVTTDLKAVADVVKDTGAALVVDAVSSLGVIDLHMDEWNVDVVVSGSHKGFMLPPGLAFIAVNEKAQRYITESKSPRYYFDLRKFKKAWEKTDTPFTPAIGIIIALNESLRIMKEKGLDNFFEKAARLAEGTRVAAEAMGLGIFPDKACLSNVLTAINLPPDIDGNKLVKIIRDEHGISMAGGQAQLKGKIIRIAHMGCVDEQDIISGLTVLEKVLNKMGYAFEPGAGVNAAKGVFKQKSLVSD